MRYRELVRADTFIGQYLAYMERQETATDYDFWCALWLLSIACGRSIYVDRPRAPVFLNLYAILVAESGVTRKSTAVRVAQQIAHKLLTATLSPVGILEGKITPERLDNVLHDRSEEHGSAQLCIAISELATFLGMDRYTTTLPALLTDLYDCPEHRQAGASMLRSGQRQERVYLTFLSASTPSWLLRSVNPNVIEGGFTSRCMFIVSDDPKKKIAWPEDDDTGNDELVAQLVAIHKLANEYHTITINETALKTFRNWYSRRKPSRDTFRVSFESREDAHVLRVAAFLCINDGAWIIQSSHLKLATRIVAEIKATSAKLFDANLERAKFVLGIEAARNVLLSMGNVPTPRSKLWLQCRKFIDNQEFAAMLDVLHEMGAIQRFVHKRDGAGRPTDLICGTQMLTNRGLIERLAERLN